MRTQGARLIVLLCAILPFLACLSTAKSSLSTEDFFANEANRRPDAEMLANIIQDSLTGIQTNDEGVSEISFSLTKIRRSIPGADFDKGLLAFKHNGHNYSVCFRSIRPRPYCWRVGQDETLVLRVATPIPDPNLMMDVGMYELWMIEDNSLGWNWNLESGYDDPAPLVGCARYDSCTRKRIRETTAHRQCR